jgi:branched-chain amino acid transport system ATP-binding protein
LRRGGLTVLLVEQKARQALKFANRAYLMETGRVIASGPAAELAAGSLISEAFLGKAPANAGVP